MRLVENEYELCSGGGHVLVGRWVCEYGIAPTGVKVGVAGDVEGVVSELMKTLARVLAPAIDAARTTLRGLDQDEVPARLRKVAASSARTLTPPLTKTLLKELDGNDWLRDKVLETWERNDEPDEISDAYLHRTTGWWLTIAAAVREETSAGESGRAEADAARIADLEQRLGVEKKRARDARERADEAEKSLARIRAADAATLRSSLETERRACATATAKADELRKELEVAGEELRTAQEETGRLLRRHLELKRERARLLRQVESGRSDSLPRDPAGLARYLDRLVVTVDPYRETAGTSLAAAPSDAGSFTLPAGITPDRAGAIESLAAASSPLVVIVDGYNVLGSIDKARMATGAARKELVGMLGRLLRSLRDGRVIAVFDSALGDGRPGLRDESGVEIRFTSAGIIADDVIVEMAADLGSGAVVISDDRDVRERSDDHGALVLWSSALIDWAARP